MARKILDHELWALIESLLSQPKPCRVEFLGRKSLDDRKVLTDIPFVLESPDRAAQ